MLLNPVIADFIQGYGVGGLRAQQLGMLPNLARVYWYTVECRTGDAGRRSSYLRLGHRFVLH
jgi:phenylalanine-4-hydroxylase